MYDGVVKAVSRPKDHTIVKGLSVGETDEPAVSQ